MSDDDRPERMGDILLRIESILLRIAAQMDCEISDCENTIAGLRKKPRHHCARHAAEVVDSGDTSV